MCNNLIVSFLQLVACAMSSFSSPPLAQDRHLDEVAVSLWRKLGLHMTKLMESRAAAWQADLNRPGGCLAAQPMTVDKKMVFRSPQYPGLVVKMSKALSDLHHEVVSMQHFHRFPKSDIWAQVPWMDRLAFRSGLSWPAHVCIRAAAHRRCTRQAAAGR